ncbi:MAG: CAP domain-containing protein [Pseudomonadota bacterium]
MPSYLFLVLLGALAAVGGGSGGSGGSSAGRSVADDSDDDNDAPAPSTPASAPAAPASALSPPTPVTPVDPGDDADVSTPRGGNDTSVGADVPNLPASAYDIGWSGLTAEEQLIVELVNRARLDPLGELGRQDDGFAAGVTTAPKEALAVVESLSDASDAHSQDMDDRNFFAHTNLDGESPSDRAIEAGHGSRFVGENIGWVGSTRTSFDQQARAEGHHDNLWDSDGHQQNFMSDRWSEIGVGYDYGSYRGYDGSTFVTEMFGDRGQTYLTGVVIEDDDGDEFYDMGEGQGDVRITAFNDEATFATATWESGGYTLALPPGTYTVVFEGGDLDMPYETEVTIGSENVKLDVIDEGGNVSTSVSAAVIPDAALIPGIEPVSENPMEMVEDDEDTVMIF